MLQQDHIEELKKKFLEYYRQLPHKSLAANFTGRTLDTINNWEKDDENFSAQVLKAKAEWAIQKTKTMRNPEWLLERVLKEEFANRQEITGGKIFVTEAPEKNEKMEIQFVCDEEQKQDLDNF